MGFTSRVLCLLTRLVTRPQTPSKICDGFYASSLCMCRRARSCPDEPALHGAHPGRPDKLRYHARHARTAERTSPSSSFTTTHSRHAEFYCFPSTFSQLAIQYFNSIPSTTLSWYRCRAFTQQRKSRELRQHCIANVCPRWWGDAGPDYIVSELSDDGFQIADYGLIYNNIYGEAFIYYVSPASLSTSSSLLTGIDIQSHLLD